MNKIDVGIKLVEQNVKMEQILKNQMELMKYMISQENEQILKERIRETEKIFL